MELTKEQVKEVEFYLDKKELFYLDVRYEVLDHIISDIEYQLKNNVSFEEAFTKAKKKWQEQLDLSSSLITGLAFFRPRIVIEKAKNFFKFWFILIVGCAILIPISKRPFFSLLINKNFELLIFTLTILCSFLIGFMYYKINKRKTTFLFLFKTQVLSVLILLPLILLEFDYSLNGVVSINTILLGTLIIIQTLFGCKLYKNYALFSTKYLLK